MKTLILIDLPEEIPEEVEKFLDDNYLDTIKVEEQPTRVLIENDSLEIL